MQIFILIKKLGKSYNNVKIVLKLFDTETEFTVILKINGRRFWSFSVISKSFTFGNLQL